jgi:hypothetical protein
MRERLYEHLPRTAAAQAAEGADDADSSAVTERGVSVRNPGTPAPAS